MFSFRNWIFVLGRITWRNRLEINGLRGFFRIFPPGRVIEYFHKTAPGMTVFGVWGGFLETRCWAVIMYTETNRSRFARNNIP